MLETLPPTWVEWPFRPGESPTVLYTENDLDLIIQAAGGLPDTPIRHGFLCVITDQLTWQIDDDAPLVARREELKFQLELMARWFRHYKKIDDFARSWRDGHAHFLKLAAQCRRLRNGMKELADYVPCSGPIHRPDCSSLITALEQLEAWCGQSAGTDPKGRRGPRWADRSQIRSLDMIYRNLFERRPTFSVGIETAGPFAQFTASCLTPLMGGNTPKPETLRKRWRNHAEGGTFKV